MAKEPKITIGIGADTSSFDKGAKEVKQGLKDLSKTGDQALSSLGAAFGVNTGKVGEMTSAIRGLGAKMTEASNTGVQAFGKLLGSITPLGGAIAGLGLAAAIAGFKQLKAEAENFKSTIDGMNMSMATSAYLSTYRQVLHDANSETGKAVAEAMDKWERGFGKFKATLGAAFVTAAGGESKWYDAFLPTRTIRGWKQVSANMAEANTKAEEAAKLGDEQADQMKEQLALDYEIKQVDYEIAALRRDANDKTKTAAEREAARAEYAQKVNEKYDKQRDLAQRMADTQEKLDDLASNTYEDTKKTYELKGKIFDIDAARENELKAVDKLEASIAKSTGAAAEAARKLREDTQKMAEAQSKWAGLGTVSTAGITPMFPGVTTPTEGILPQSQAERWYNAIRAQMGDMVIGVRFRLDNKQELVDITNEVVSLVESAANKTGEILGGLVGNLISGGDAWGDFKNAAVSAFGDMAIAIGKVAIAAGTAALGIDAMLKNPSQGALAIAAGVALVALGTAVKASLSSVASGDYSAAGGGYSSAAETREVTVNVTGSLEANGDQLIAVINNTNRSNYYKK